MRPFHRIRPIHAALIAAACCVLAAGCTSSSTSGTGGNKGTEQEAKTVKDKFDKVKTDMSEKEVADLMGAPTSSAELDPAKAKEMFPGGFTTPNLPGLPPVSLPKMTVKVWEEGDMAYSVIFQNEKVANKASGKKEAGKKEAGKQAAKISKENFDKIKVGMKKPEVEDILGKGKTEVGAKVQGFAGTDIMVWDGDEGMITIGFADDKVAAPPVWVAKKK